MFAIDDNSIGQITISELGLNREALAEERRELLKLLKSVAALATMNTPDSHEARQLLRDHMTDQAEYSAMVRAAFSNNGAET